MKSQQTKKRIARELDHVSTQILMRHNDPHLTALYDAFLPGARRAYTPKFRTDLYGNRVLNEGVRV